ncbi:hypothetical protein V6246_03335 [Algibacter sp. TI.3.09]|uniref:hypothetical protein n=1 Tax=Algibacter sp. TI.3.09 TaxID=3121298 RepID=UPI00311FB585
MKNLTQKTLILITMLFVSCIYAQQEKGIIGNDNWLSYWTDFKPKTNDYGQPSQILTGNITEDTKLTKREIYLLVGNVFVTGNATLTIEPGTIIMGDSKSNGSLIISKGSTLIAEGLETDPIVFTSSKDIKKSGDWGGLFILGDAPINQMGGVSNVKYGFQQVSNQNALYGGENARSNSGVLKYVRIEYAGKRTKDNGYFSGITMAGVGSETVLENVMVTYCKGNSFNVIGGVVNLDKMVSYRSNGNDFDFNYGTQCNITNSLAIRSPYVSGSEESRSMSISSYNRKEEVDYSKKSTLVTAKNISIINLSNDLASAIEIGLVKEGIYVSKDASLNMSKSVISGFNPAVILDNEIELSTENLNKLKFSEMYFNNSNGNIFIKDKPNNEDLENWYGNSLFFNVYSKGSDSETFIDSQDAKNLDFRLKIDEIIASN